jgi:hypothetical protein
MVEWQSISLADLLARIEQGFGRMTEQERALWLAVRLPPQKLHQLPYGVEGDGFWVVGIIGSTVLWYNDIEEGFNRSLFSTFGTIDDYWANQDELEIAIRYLFNALSTGNDLVVLRDPPEAVP